MPTPVDAQLRELLLQALETELGGVKVYETAIRCARNEDLRKEWEDYLAQTREHVRVVATLLEALAIDPGTQTPGRRAVARIGQSLVEAMQGVEADGDAVAAELTACECVVLAETKDHANWELIGHVASHGDPPQAALLLPAYERVETQEDHHLYHTKGWCRESWIQALGLPAVLPPPEEVRNVGSAVAAARAQQTRDVM